jgi:stress response protein YsnF
MSQWLCDCASGLRDHSAVGPVDESRDARRAESVVLSILDSVSEKVDAVDCERKIAVADQVVGKAVEAREALLRYLRCDKISSHRGSPAASGRPSQDRVAWNVRAPLRLRGRRTLFGLFDSAFPSTLFFGASTCNPLPNQGLFSSASDEGAQADDMRIAAVKEELDVGVRAVETGAVRIRKVIREDMQSVPVTLRSQTVDVQRFTVNKPVEQKFGPRQEGDTLIIPVFEYVPIITMQLTLKEEVHVTTTESQQQVFQNVLLNTEELVVDRRDGASGEWKTE